MKAVIQAGGKGTRLSPYTLILPKPMMPVGDQPVIELLLKWLRRNNVTEVFVTTGHLAHLIQTFCGDGSQWGLSIEYCEEPEPLGTVGALHLLKDKLNGQFLMLNGDLITDLNLLEFKNCHLYSNAPLTIATKVKEVAMDFGVLETRDSQVVSFKEKPKLPVEVSMGVYLMEPSILEYIPKGVPFGFDNLMMALLDAGVPVNTFRHGGAWMDIGRIEDFQKAQEDWTSLHQEKVLGI